MTDQLPSKDLSSLLVDTAQLLDGWKQTSPQDWSEWDQSVRDRLSQQLALLEASKRVTVADLAKTVDARASGPSKDLSRAPECCVLGCQRSAAVKLIDELRAQNVALMAECAHYREKLRELSSAATAALTVKS